MTKEKVFRFRIKEETKHLLDIKNGVGVVKDYPPRYKLYKKVPFIFGVWKKEQFKKKFLKKHKKEFKTTVKIVVDFDIPA